MVVERLLHNAVGTHPPVAFATARSHLNFSRVCTQRDEVASARADNRRIDLHDEPNELPLLRLCIVRSAVVD